MLLLRAKILLRPLAVRLGLRPPLPPAEVRAQAGVKKAPNPVQTAALPAEVTRLVKQYAEKNISLFLLDPGMVERQNLAIARTVRAFFQTTQSFCNVGLEALVAQIARFRRVFMESPITRNDGGANFPSGLNLFLMAHYLDPRLVVESGVYKGQSSYLLAAACPSAKLQAFDPNLQQLVYRTPGVTYHQSDWMQADVKCDPAGSGLCFFDDHWNQARRIIQAHERGFRHVIVDDSWPIEAVTGCGWPPLPSVDMVVGNTLAPGEVVRWIEIDKMWTYTHDEEMQELCAQARRLIKAAYEVPSLYRECGIAPTSAYKFIELV